MLVSLRAGLGGEGSMDHAVFSMAYTVKLYKIMQYYPHLTDEEMQAQAG